MAAALLSRSWRGYHQYHAVNVALEETLRASRLPELREPGRAVTELILCKAANQVDRRVGVIWHTQGAGKSLTMAFYAGK